VNRGDIVLVMLPYTDASGGKLRPAVVISADALNQRSRDVVLVPVTTNTSQAGTHPTQVLIDITTPDGRASGLLRTSVVRCERPATIHSSLIQRTIGRMPPTLMSLIETALRLALALP
jgi:mRNA interferase MazF